MASILIINGNAVVALTAPDGDGEHSWNCLCGQTADFQPAGDAIANAEVHVDIQCPLRPRPEIIACERCGNPGTARIDPYLSEISGIDDLHALCGECERERAADI